jgi:outer membrane lipoprotein-sorting protein
MKLPTDLNLMLPWFLLIIPLSANGAEWTLETLMEQLKQTGERRAQFTETRELAILEQPIEQSGTLTFQPPDRLIRTLAPPSTTRTVIEGNRLILWKNNQRQQTLLLDNLPELLAFSASFRAILAGDEETLNRYFTTHLEGDGATWRLTLTPKQSSVATHISHIDVDGRGPEIERYTFIETSGDRTVTELTPIHE